MGEVLRPREGERLLSEARTAHRSPAITPERHNHWSRLTRITHNLAGQAPPCGRRPPCPRADVTVAGPARWGPRRTRSPNRLSGYGIGPSVADPVAFSPPAQGGSLLASNGRITEQRPIGLDRQRRVSFMPRTKLLTDGQKQTDRRPGLTPSNSGHDYQDLVKRGRIDTRSANPSRGQHASACLATGQTTDRITDRTVTVRMSRGRRRPRSLAVESAGAVHPAAAVAMTNASMSNGLRRGDLPGLASAIPFGHIRTMTGHPRSAVTQRP